MRKIIESYQLGVAAIIYLYLGYACIFHPEELERPAELHSVRVVSNSHALICQRNAIELLCPLPHIQHLYAHLSFLPDATDFVLLSIFIAPPIDLKGVNRA